MGCCAARCHPEAADDFVEDQQGACILRQVPQLAQVVGALQQQAVVGRNRLDEHGRNVLSSLAEELLQGRLIVEGQDERLVGEGRGDPGRGRHPEGRQPRSRFDKQVVRVAVVAASELHDQVALRGAAGQPDRTHDGLGAGRHEANLLNHRAHRCDALGQRDLTGARQAKGRARRGALRDCSNHIRMRVAENQGTPGSDEVQIRLTIDVVDVRASSALDHRRGAAHRPEGANGGVHAARHDGFGLGKKRLGTRSSHVSHPC